MTLLTTTRTVDSLLPDEYGGLITRPMMEIAICMAQEIAINVSTELHSYRLPVVVDDPKAAWTVEGEEIPMSDALIDECVVEPAKLAGLTSISTEMVEDGDPNVLKIVGDGLARDLSRKADQAFFAAGGHTTNGADGIDSVDANVVQVPEITNLDPFSEALALSEQANAVITGWVANPAAVLKLSQLKVQDGSNQILLGADPTSPTSRSILGVPLHSSPAVPAGTIWGIAKDFVFTVLGSDVKVQADGSVFFTSDRVALRGTLRLGWGFPHPKALTKIVIGDAS